MATASPMKAWTASEPVPTSVEELVRVGFAQVSNHPVLLKKLTLLRRRETPPREFRTLVKEITFYLGYEATRTLTTRPAVVETPLGEHEGVQLAQHICICPVLRAGLGMLDPMLELLPNADVHHIGMYRNKSSLLPIQYYNKLPRRDPAVGGGEGDVAFVLDPMLATAATMSACVAILKQWGAAKIVVVCLVASRPGLARLHAKHPDVTVFCGEIDASLTDSGFIFPGLGDAGDRLFSTPAEAEARGRVIRRRESYDAAEDDDEAPADGAPAKLPRVEE